MWNRHRESKNTKLVQIQNFITFELKVFQHEERETQSFSADCLYIISSQPNQHTVPVVHKVVWPHPALKVNLLLLRRELNSAFSQISAHGSSAWHHPNTLVPVPIWDFYLEWYIFSACAWTPASMLHLTNPCTKRMILSLTKPNGKIYKKKSLSNCIILCCKRKRKNCCTTNKAFNGRWLLGQACFQYQTIETTNPAVSYNATRLCWI